MLSEQLAAVESMLRAGLEKEAEADTASDGESSRDPERRLALIAVLANNGSPAASSPGDEIALPSEIGHVQEAEGDNGSTEYGLVDDPHLAHWIRRALSV